MDRDAQKIKYHLILQNSVMCACVCAHVCVYVCKSPQLRLSAGKGHFSCLKHTVRTPIIDSAVRARTFRSPCHCIVQR